LTFGQSPPISLEEFYHDAKSQLSPKQFKKLEGFDLQKQNKNDSLEKLKGVKTMLDDLHQDIAEMRSSKEQSRNPNLNSLPKSIIGMNPLDREKTIMKWQWEELESVAFGQTFSFNQVLVYKLKLQILSRLKSFNTKRGLGVLNSVVNPSKKVKENGRGKD
jgi:hypothetical protein